MLSNIRTYLKKQHPPAVIDRLRDDESLLKAGIVDSALMIELVLFLEQRFQISIPEDDMTPENFDSLSAIERYLQSRVGSRS